MRHRAGLRRDLQRGKLVMLVLGNTSLRVRTAITISSRDALPARSPNPFTVHSTCRAPFITADSELATASPRSLWQWTDHTAWSEFGMRSRSDLIKAPNCHGI